MSKSICSSCKQIFNSVSTFDRHRIGDFMKIQDLGRKTSSVPSQRRCMTVEEILADGMIRNEKGWWIASAYDPKAHGEEDESA